MGKVSSVVPQLDFLSEKGIKPCHKPTKLTGQHNIEAYESLCAKGDVGLTAVELEAERGWSIGRASLCLSELRWLRLARKAEAKRQNHSVYIAVIRSSGTVEPDQCEERSR